MPRMSRRNPFALLGFVCTVAAAQDGTLRGGHVTVAVPAASRPAGAEPIAQAFMPFSEIEQPDPASSESTSEVEELKAELREELHRTRIAEVASEAARNNVTVQENARITAEQQRQGLQGQLAIAQQGNAEARQKVADLEEQRREARAAIKDAQARQDAAGVQLDNATAALRAAEDRMESERVQIDDVLPQQRQTAIFGELSAFGDWLRHCQYQHIVALVAGLLGLLSIVDPPEFFQALSVGIFAVGLGMAGAQESETYWGSDLSPTLEFLIGLEVAVIAAAAAVLGFEGFRLLVGAGVGLLLTHIASTWAMVSAWDISDGVVWFGVSAALGAGLIAVGGRTSYALLGPVAGGLMVASSVGFFITDFSTPSDVTPSWIDCVDSLLGGGGGASNAFGQGATAAVYTGDLLWAVVALAGSWNWFFGFPRVIIEEEKNPGRARLLGGSSERAPAPLRATGAPPVRPMPPPSNPTYAQPSGSRRNPYDIY